MRFDGSAEAGFRHPSPGDARLIGALLVARGSASAAQIDAALAAQTVSEARLGRIAVSRGWASAGAVAAAAAEQAGFRTAAPGDITIDATLGRAADAPVYLRRRMAPWRREGERIAWIAADRDEALAGLRELGAEGSPVALADGVAIADAVARTWPAALAERAATRAPEAMSARGRAGVTQRRALVALLAATVALAVFWPGPTALALFMGVAALNALNAAFRLAVLTRALRPLRDPAPEPRPGAALHAADSAAARAGMRAGAVRGAAGAGLAARAARRQVDP